MGKIFISYRREDTGPAADRLFDDLSREFGKGQILMDRKSLKVGSSFVDQLVRTVNSCRAVLVLIGPKWLARLRERINEDDYMVLEIREALKTGIPAIPVLLDDVTMPQAEHLPSELKSFALHQAVEISQKRWDQDVSLLIARLRDLQGGKWKGKAQVAAAGGGAVAGVVAANTGLGFLGAAGLGASIPVVMGTMAVALPVGAVLGGFLAFKGLKRLLDKI